MSDSQVLPALTDAELLGRSALGDSGAFDAFVARHRAWLYRHAQALSIHQADDVLQDTFVDAWRGAHTFHGANSARAWLATLARNALRRRYRRHVGEPAEHDTLEALDRVAVAAGWGALDPAESFERTMTREAIERALARLDAAEREAVVLCDLEGFTADEAAGVVGASRAALKSRLHRGRLRLSAELQEFRHGRS